MPKLAAAINESSETTERRRQDFEERLRSLERVTQALRTDIESGTVRVCTTGPTDHFRRDCYFLERRLAIDAGPQEEFAERLKCLERYLGPR